MANTYRPDAPGKSTAASCNCRLLPPVPGKVRDLLQEWIADHPGHARKQHILAYDVFKWLDGRSNGGRA